MTLYPKITFLFASNILHSMSGYLLLVFGLYNAFVAYKALFVSLNTYNKKLVLKNNFKGNYFSSIDLSFLILVFIFENMFLIFIFYSTLNLPEYFGLTSFIFHYTFFAVGFNLGLKIKKILSF